MAKALPVADRFEVENLDILVAIVRQSADDLALVFEGLHFDGCQARLIATRNHVTQARPRQAFLNVAQHEAVHVGINHIMWPGQQHPREPEKIFSRQTTQR